MNLVYSMKFVANHYMIMRSLFSTWITPTHYCPFAYAPTSTTATLSTVCNRNPTPAILSLFHHFPMVIIGTNWTNYPFGFFRRFFLNEFVTAFRYNIKLSNADTTTHIQQAMAIQRPNNIVHTQANVISKQKSSGSPGNGSENSRQIYCTASRKGI